MAKLRYVQTHIAADLLGITTHEVRRLITRGELSAIKKGPRWFVSMDDVTKLHRKSGEPFGELTVEPTGELTIDRPTGELKMTRPGPPGELRLIGSGFKMHRKKPRRRKTKDYLTIKTTEDPHGHLS